MQPVPDSVHAPLDSFLGFSVPEMSVIDAQELCGFSVTSLPLVNGDQMKYTVMASAVKRKSKSNSHSASQGQNSHVHHYMSLKRTIPPEPETCQKRLKKDFFAHRVPKATGGSVSKFTFPEKPGSSTRIVTWNVNGIRSVDSKVFLSHSTTSFQ